MHNPQVPGYQCRTLQVSVPVPSASSAKQQESPCQSERGAPWNKPHQIGHNEHTVFFKMPHRSNSKFYQSTGSHRIDTVWYSIAEYATAYSKTLITFSQFLFLNGKGCFPKGFIKARGKDLLSKVKQSTPLWYTAQPKCAKTTRSPSSAYQTSPKAESHSYSPATPDVVDSYADQNDFQTATPHTQWPAKCQRFSRERSANCSIWWSFLEGLTWIQNHKDFDFLRACSYPLLLDLALLPHHFRLVQSSWPR